MILRRLPQEMLAVDIGAQLDPLIPISVVVEDLLGGSKFSWLPNITDTSGKVVLNLSQFGNYDRTIIVAVHNSSGDLLYEVSIDIARPYVVADPSVTDLDDFYRKEQIARSVIDNSTGGFYMTKRKVTYESLGGDAISLQEDILRILRAWENGVLVYDQTNPSFRSIREFTISPDRSMIYIDGARNRRFGNDTNLEWAATDYLSYDYSDIKTRPYWQGEFSYGSDYVFEIESGFRTVPADIQLATKILMDSGACDNKYFNNYIDEYSTDQYRISFNPLVFKSTGNRQVDQILAKYLTSNRRIKAGVM